MLGKKLNLTRRVCRNPVVSHDQTETCEYFYDNSIFVCGFCSYAYSMDLEIEKKYFFLQKS